MHVIYLFLARDTLPCLTIEKTGFMDFSDKSFPNLLPGSRRTLGRIGNDMLEEMELEVVEQLESNKDIFGAGTLAPPRLSIRASELLKIQRTGPIKSRYLLVQRPK